MSKRTKTEVIISRAIFEQKVDTIASLQVSIQTLEAERDTRVEAILLHYNAQIKAHETEIKAEQQACQAYAQLNWSQLAPDGLRSAETPLATYGFRTGMPQVKKLVNRTEEEMAAELFAQGQTAYVNTKHSLDKPAILKALQAGCDWLAKLFTITQGETFYIAPKAQQETK